MEAPPPTATAFTAAWLCLAIGSVDEDQAQLTGAVDDQPEQIRDAIPIRTTVS